MNHYEEKLSHLKASHFSNDKQIKKVIEVRRFIADNYDKDVNLDLLAKVNFTSKFHLQRLFKKYYGMTPRQYLTDKRIEGAKNYLSTGMKVTDTCFAVGFTSLGSFSKLFKSKTGKSPSDFQKSKFREEKFD